jgi:hypothetical protein
VQDLGVDLTKVRPLFERNDENRRESTPHPSKNDWKIVLFVTSRAGTRR